MNFDSTQDNFIYEIYGKNLLYTESDFWDEEDTEMDIMELTSPKLNGFISCKLFFSLIIFVYLAFP